MRTGPGAIAATFLCDCACAKAMDRLRRSRVSSPSTSRRRPVCVTGSNSICRPGGSVRDIAARSPGPNSNRSSEASSIALRRLSGELKAEESRYGAHLLDRQRVRIVRSDPANARVDRERDLDKLVEDRLAVARAERTMILGAADRFERIAAVEHAAATGTHHVPRHVEQPKARRMDERGDGRVFVQFAARGQCKRVDPIERAIFAVSTSAERAATTAPSAVWRRSCRSPDVSAMLSSMLRRQPRPRPISAAADRPGE